MRCGPVLAALLLAGGTLCAQAVRVHSCLPEGAELRVRELIAAELPDLEVAIRRGTTGGITAAVRAGTSDAELVVGVDGVHAAELARRERLASYASPRAADLNSRFRGPDDRFVVPWLSPLVIALVRGRWSGDLAPRTFDELVFEPRFRDDDHVLLCVPDAMPGLWVAWIQDRIRRGRDEATALAWLRTLDARVGGYEDSVEGVLTGLAEGRGSISVLSVADLESVGGLDYVVPDSGAPSQGLAVALVAGRDSAGARRLYDWLVSPEVGYQLAQEHLVPSPRDDLEVTRLPDRMRDELMPSLLPYDHQNADPERWFASWRDTVQGQGSHWEWLDFALDGLFAIGFAVFLYFVYRSMQASPK